MAKEFMDMEDNINKLREAYTVLNVIAEEKNGVDNFLERFHRGDYGPELAIEYCEQRLKRVDDLLDLSIGVIFYQINSISDIFDSELKRRRELSE